MTPYRFDNQKKRHIQVISKYVLIVVSSICIGVLVIFLGTFIVQKIMQGPAWISRTFNDQVATTINTFTPKSLLIKHINQLQIELDEKKSALIALQAVEYDYQQLRKAIGYESITTNTITARVTGKPGRSLFNTLVIDRGSRDGIEVGDLVVTEKTIALGQVASTTIGTATVTLFSGPQFQDLLTIAGQEGVTVPAEGVGSGNFEIHIPREIEVVEGGLLVLPENPLMVVGIIKSIKFDPRDPFQKILARTPVNIQELRFVEVVK